MPELAIRDVLERAGHNVADLTDEQLLDAAEIMLERFQTTLPAASMRAEVLDEVRAEGGTPAASRPRPAPTLRPPLLKPTGPTYKQPGWWERYSPLRKPPPAAELLAFERDHPEPIKTPAELREIRKRWGRSWSAYLYALQRAAESPEGREADAETCARVIGRRDHKRALRGRT